MNAGDLPETSDESELADHLARALLDLYLEACIAVENLVPMREDLRDALDHAAEALEEHFRNHWGSIQAPGLPHGRSRSVIA